MEDFIQMKAFTSSLHHFFTIFLLKIYQVPQIFVHNFNEDFGVFFVFFFPQINNLQ